MPDCTLLIWLHLFNLIYRSGEVPSEWKHATVVHIPKPGKDKIDPKSYRPISLTSHAGKLLEIMVKNILKHIAQDTQKNRLSEMVEKISRVQLSMLPV